MLSCKLRQLGAVRQTSFVCGKPKIVLDDAGNEWVVVFIEDFEVGWTTSWWKGEILVFAEDFEVGWTTSWWKGEILVFAEDFESGWPISWWKGEILVFAEDFEFNWPWAPIVDFSGSPLSGLNPILVTFTDLTVHYSANISYYWSFGDGGHSALQNPTHNYNNPGTYNVTLTVRDLSGETTLTKIGYVVAT